MERQATKLITAALQEAGCSLLTDISGPSRPGGKTIMELWGVAGAVWILEKYPDGGCQLYRPVTATNSIQDDIAAIKEATKSV